MQESLLEVFDLLLKFCNCPCPYSIFRQSSIREALKEFKTLTKEKALAIFNYLKRNSMNYETLAYQQVIKEMEKHLSKG
ncbi:MAG: hypothetical protein NZ942_00240 [Candidatus Aenigmarchaeota archaeon]|nr:hypothetical protein [Candidatus Aenigmarchaeota archaeon]